MRSTLLSGRLWITPLLFFCVFFNTQLKSIVTSFWKPSSFRSASKALGQSQQVAFLSQHMKAERLFCSDCSFELRVFPCHTVKLMYLILVLASVFNNWNDESKCKFPFSYTSDFHPQQSAETASAQIMEDLLVTEELTFQLNPLSVWFKTIGPSLSTFLNPFLFSYYDTSLSCFSFFFYLCNCSFSIVFLDFSSSDCLKVMVLQSFFLNPIIYVSSQTSFLSLWPVVKHLLDIFTELWMSLPTSSHSRSHTYCTTSTALQTIPFLYPLLLPVPANPCPRLHAWGDSTLDFLQLCHSLCGEESVGPKRYVCPAPHHFLATQDPSNPCTVSFPGLFFQGWTASLGVLPGPTG